MNEQSEHNGNEKESENPVVQTEVKAEQNEFNNFNSYSIGCCLGAIVPTVLAFLLPRIVLHFVGWLLSGPDGDIGGPIAWIAAWLVSIPLTAIVGALGWNIICRVIYNARKRQKQNLK